MPQTYGSHESKIYYVEESTFGEPPQNPTMLSVPAESIEPQISSNNIKIRGVGSIDLQAIKKGTRTPTLKVVYSLPSDAPLNLLQYAKTELGKSLSVQVLYFKGAFSTATDILSLLYTGCKVQSATVECSIDNTVKATVDLLGQNVASSTAKISGATYADYVGAVPFYESYIKKESSTLDRVTDWKFTVGNSLKAVPVIRSSNGDIAKYLPNCKRDLSGELVFEFESKEEFDVFIHDSEFDLEFGLGGSSKAVFGDCKWEDVATPTRIEDLVSLKATFVAKTLTLS